MRIKRLKHLDSRKAACEGYLISAKSDDLNFATAGENKEYIDLKEWFGTERPLWLEIGCGKGQFACELAKRHPEINIIAVEKNTNVIVQACEKAMEQGINNVRFLKCGAEYITRYLKPHSVGRLFLNFSCPFPKKSHTSHRLTSPTFLPLYRELLTEGAEIHQKTDNRQLFEFSLEQLSEHGFTLKNISLDLHNSDFEGNIVTEYEQRFVSQGLPIYRLEAYIK
ncbi:MAG: tRNA (guanosine(46)-N7)-methyltransferase TrmB [Clostridia bacterium]|nr:tRNA (guanosine(46)-N7)-methyltransferase TrmB [Clostridia bacterium]